MDDKKQASPIKSIEELRKLRKNLAGTTDIRVTGENPERTIIRVGMATCGIAAGARPVMNTLLEEVRAHDLHDVSVVATGCAGFCYAEPLVEVEQYGKEIVRYGKVNPEAAARIIVEHIIGGNPLDGMLLGKEGAQGE